MTAEEKIEALMAMVRENTKAIQDLRDIADVQREDLHVVGNDLHRIEAMVLEDNEYVKGQKSAIREIEDMLPPTPGWKPNPKRIFRMMGGE